MKGITEERSARNGLPPTKGASEGAALWNVGPNESGRGEINKDNWFGASWSDKFGCGGGGGHVVMKGWRKRRRAAGRSRVPTATPAPPLAPWAAAAYVTPDLPLARAPGRCSSPTPTCSLSLYVCRYSLLALAQSRNSSGGWGSLPFPQDGARPRRQPIKPADAMAMPRDRPGCRQERADSQEARAPGSWEDPRAASSSARDAAPLQRETAERADRRGEEDRGENCQGEPLGWREPCPRSYLARASFFASSHCGPFFATFARYAEIALGLITKRASMLRILRSSHRYQRIIKGTSLSSALLSDWK